MVRREVRVARLHGASGTHEGLGGSLQQGTRCLSALVVSL